MSKPCENLQKVFSDILNDVMSMSADVIRKSDLYLKDLQNLDSTSADVTITNIETFLDRINTNLNSFTKTFQSAVNNFKFEIDQNNGISPRNRLKLSLKKSAKVLESDSDLSQSHSQERTNSEIVRAPETTDTSNSAEQSTSAHTNENERIVDVSKDSRIQNSSSDNDSEKTVQYFELPSINDPEDSDGDYARDNLNRALDELERHKESAERESSNITKYRTGSTSFDFDDLNDDFLNEAINKMEVALESRRRIEKDNNELLCLLNKAVGDCEPDPQLTEEEVIEALKILENDASSSTDLEDNSSWASTSLDLGHDQSVDEIDEDMISTANASDTENVYTADVEEDTESEIVLKELTINLGKHKIDEWDNSEIDRLCNLHNLNKRKCTKEISKVKRKRLKRIRMLSTSSSSSSASANYFSSDDSSTPDLVIDSQTHCESSTSPSPIIDERPDITALADELVDKLDEEDDVSTDSSLDLDDGDDEEGNTAKSPKKREVNVNDNKTEQKDENEIPEKKRGSWRHDIQLWSETDSDDENERKSNDDIQEIINNDSLEIKDEDVISNDAKENGKEVKIFSEITTITSSDSSDSEDCTVVETPDVISEGMIGKGRRNIRAILSDNELNALTQRAKEEEDERIMRLEEHSRTVESIQSERDEFILDADPTTGKALITVDYDLASGLKPHQKEGVQFMWKACYESVETLKKKSGTGCILAHCMGLGKTLQIITLVHTLFTHSVTRTKHVLIICPLSIVHNWKNEFKMAFTKLSQTPRFSMFFINKGDLKEKISQINLWKNKGGVLVMGYESFQILTNAKIASRVTEQHRNVLLEALVDPGPDLIVCDEGHQLKNGKTLRTKALMKVKTKRRIVLTGTPLQNNLTEYYHMVQFVKPHILGTWNEYMNRFGTPIANGQYHDSRPEDIKLMKKRTHVLNKLLRMTIHRVESSVLQSYLPEIIDYTVLIRLTPLQVDLYAKYVDMVTSRTTNLSMFYLHDSMVLSFLNLHPYTLELYYKKPKPKTKKKRNNLEDITNITNVDDRETDNSDHVISSDWYKEFFPDDVSTNVQYSSKLKLILNAIDETVRNGEKALVFSRFLVELDLLEHFLKMVGTTNFRGWRPNIDYYRMDGDTPVDTRDGLCKSFNDKQTAKLFMLTHKVGGLGLNLTGANRVIMIGANHNPSLDTQSMYRVYRFGQKKNCYIYRLLSLGTMEEKIYHRCVIKLQLSGTVVDKLHFGRPFTANDYKEMYKIVFDKYQNDRPIPVVPTDKLLALLIQNCNDIFKYHLHNSLLENRPEEELTDEDKKLAWDEFNSMEEAAKQAAAAALPPLPSPSQLNALVRIPVNSLNARFSTLNNRAWLFNVPRNPVANMVPNPLNDNARGFLPRGLQLTGMRPTAMSTPNQTFTNNQLAGLFNQNTPPTNGSNRRLFHNNAVQNAIQDFEKLRTPLPVARQLQVFAQAYRDRIRNVTNTDETPPSGEFNYALNKVL